jgi:Arc/MetJ family transcription regulator
MLVLLRNVSGIHATEGSQIAHRLRLRCCACLRCPNADTPKQVDMDAKLGDNGFMKTTIDIPDAVLEEAMVFTKARTKREAIVTAVEEFNRRRRMAALVKHAGTCDGFMSADQVRLLRRKG